MTFQFEPGIEPTGQRIQEVNPVSLVQIVNHLLRLGEVINMGKAIALFVVTDAGLIQATRKVFTPVQTNLDGHGKPSLQSDLHQAKFPIDKVEIEEQALSIGTAGHVPQHIQRRVP